MRIETWTEGDLGLLRLANAPDLMGHLGGSESEEKILIRHRRYVETAGAGNGGMFSIVALPKCEKVGTVGYWEIEWQGQTVYETGWAVLPPSQGKGIGAAAIMEAIASARAESKHRFIHAFPSVNNSVSKAICRNAGFLFVAECDFEYPPRTVMRCNAWCLDLTEAT